MHRTTALLIFACALLQPLMAQAYVGPGLGAGTLSIILGFLASIFLALFAVLWYPIKRVIRKFKSRKNG
jgi:hypothetical protein